MLIIRRRIGERIVIGSDIEIVVTEVTSRGVRFGVKAPRGLNVIRGEVHDAIAAATTAANEANEAAVEEAFEIVTAKEAS
jgi:carbon storage regulator